MVEHLAGGVQYDDQGRAYLLKADGTRYYLSPVAMGTYNTSLGGGLHGHASGGNFIRGNDQWNSRTGEIERGGLAGTNLLNAAVGALFTGGLANAFGGAAGGAAGAGGVDYGVGATVPELGLTSGQSAAAALGAGEGLGSAGVIGVPPSLAATAPVAPGSSLPWSGAAKTAAKPGLRDVLTRLGVAGGMLGLGRAVGGGGAPPIPPEIQQILDLQRQRMQMQNPLFEAVTRLAMSRLPVTIQPGGR